MLLYVIIYLFILRIKNIIKLYILKCKTEKAKRRKISFCYAAVCRLFLFIQKGHVRKKKQVQTQEYN